MVFIPGFGRTLVLEAAPTSRFTPLICDFVIKDDLGDPATILRFDSIEGLADPGEIDLTIDHMSVEPVLGASAFVVSVVDFRDIILQYESFVARAFDVPKRQWPHTIDADLVITYSMGGTRVTVKALTGMGSFSRVTDYIEPGGIPSISEAMFMPSNEMRLWSWVTANDAIESLIQLNTPGEANPGGL